MGKQSGLRTGDSTASMCELHLLVEMCVLRRIAAAGKEVRGWEQEKTVHWKWQSKVTDETDPGEKEEGPIKASE